VTIRGGPGIEMTSLRVGEDPAHGGLPGEGEGRHLAGSLVGRTEPRGERASASPDQRRYVTTLINAVMGGPAWKHRAIFLAWDDGAFLN